MFRCWKSRQGKSYQVVFLGFLPPPVSQWSKTGDKTKIPKIFGLFFFIKLKHCKFSNRLRQPERSKARGGKNPTNSTDEEGDVFFRRMRFFGIPNPNCSKNPNLSRFPRYRAPWNTILLDAFFLGLHRGDSKRVFEYRGLILDTNICLPGGYFDNCCNRGS